MMSTYLALWTTQYPIFLYVVILLFLLCIGSFLNVVIYRLPLMLERQWQQECQFLLQEIKHPPLPEKFNLCTPRSHCPHCQHPVSIFSNIPLFSYLLQRGKCTHCKAAISYQYPLVELLTALIGSSIIYYMGWNIQSLGLLLLSFSLIALTFIDFHKHLLPDDVTLPLIWIGLLFNLNATYTTLSQAVLGAIIGYLSLWLFYMSFKLLTGKEGMGHGDFKLLSVFGAWGGLTILPATILIASFLGACVGVSCMVLKKYSRHTPIPFGPYLAIGGMVALLFGHKLNQIYLHYAFGVH